MAAGEPVLWRSKVTIIGGHAPSMGFKASDALRNVRAYFGSRRISRRP